MNNKYQFPTTWDKKIKSKWYTYTNRTKKRGYEFTLTYKEFEDYLNSHCVYCGETDYQTIDRIDSCKGYTNNNCQTLCLSCNILKSAYNEQKLLDKIDKIFKFRHKIV